MFIALSGVVLATALGQTPPPASSPAVAPAPGPVTSLELSGTYSVWGLSQHNFMLGTDHPLNDAAYIVQMLRVDGTARRSNMGVRARLDLAQGWWGVDNDPNVQARVEQDADGSVSSTSTYNADAMFGNKGTFYPLHVDLAYGWVDLPTRRPVQVRLGRQYFGVGHKIVLDMEYDGFQVEVQASDATGLQLWWAKVGEGIGSRTVPTGVVMSDAGARADADLFGVVARRKTEFHRAEAFALYYQDRSSADDWTALPNDLGYQRSRHTPNVTLAAVVGLALDGTLDVGPGLDYAVEGTGLAGLDEVDNTTYAGGLLDVNDGTLRGYNAYFTLDQHLPTGRPVELGLLFGLGSGDPDKTGGVGNLQRLQTMGSFPLTYVWEDSVMPDLAGITPQGLGSPVSRGYRELENTTAAQARVGAQPTESWLAGVSYTYLRATTPVTGFDGDGAPSGAGVHDLGQEVDAHVAYTLSTAEGEGPTAALYGGVFFPGEAASNLIVGRPGADSPAWELKSTLLMKF